MSGTTTTPATASTAIKLPAKLVDTTDAPVGLADIITAVNGLIDFAGQPVTADIPDADKTAIARLTSFFRLG